MEEIIWLSEAKSEETKKRKTKRDYQVKENNDYFFLSFF
jgi:hypothetical protein